MGDAKMKKINDLKAVQDKENAEATKQAGELEDEKNHELEERAVRLMESTRTIELGKNLEKGIVQKDVRSKKPAAVKPTEPKASKKPRSGATGSSEAPDRSPTR